MRLRSAVQRELKEMASTKRKTMEMENFATFPRHKHYKKSKKEKNSKEEQPWSDLPTEILEYIMANLYLSDVTSFHVVCKNWSSIERLPHQLLIRYGYRCSSPKSQIPWLMISNSETHLTSSFTLIDPSFSSYKKTHTIKIEGIGPNYKTQVCSTKVGWLLLSHSHFNSHSIRNSFFLYSHFINERIDLPDLNSAFVVATFTSLPTSPDCVFFALHYTTDRLTISTCRQGDMAWKSCSFFGWFWPIKDVVSSKGKFYCSTIHGGLVAFDVSQQSWSILSKREPLSYDPDSSCDSFMVEDEDEELLLVFIRKSSRQVLVYKLDKSGMMWVRVRNFIDKSLFISSSTSVVVPKNKRTKSVMNRIYYCLPNQPPMFYSFKAEKSYQVSSTYGDLPAKGFPKKFLWIEAPS